MGSNDELEWFDPIDFLPPEDVEIVAELDGCKIGRYILMNVRYGEGFGHIKRWRYLNKGERNEKV